MLKNIPLALGTLFILLLYHKVIEAFITLDSERDLFKSGHLQFVHNLKEGLVIMKDSSFNTVKLINVAARQMLQLPFAAGNDDGEVDARYIEKLELKRIELGKQTEPEAVDIGANVFRSETAILFKDAIEQSLKEGDASSN